jgi:hypothetical protein
MRIDGPVHYQIIHGFVTQYHAPSAVQVAAQLGVSTEEVVESFRRLQDAHGLALHPQSTAIWVAPPFSASPTGVWVASGTRGWWAPCIWCALGISVLAAPDATVHVRLGGESKETRIVLCGGELTSANLMVHFSVPARDAWENIIHYCATVLPFECLEDVTDWCDRHALPQGDVVALEKVLVLAREWYGRYLDQDWAKWTLKEAQAIFDRVGLRGDAWRLPSGEGVF